MPFFFFLKNAHCELVPCPEPKPNLTIWASLGIALLAPQSIIIAETGALSELFIFLLQHSATAQQRVGGAARCKQCLDIGSGEATLKPDAVLFFSSFSLPQPYSQKARTERRGRRGKTVHFTLDG